MLIYTDDQNYTNIANAIRELKGCTDTYKPEEMAPALDMMFFDYGISYDKFKDGYPTQATEVTTYGKKVVGAAGNEYLEKINFSEDAEEIGDCAFAYCRNIDAITIPNTIKKIGAYAFCECNDIRHVSIPDSVTSIGEYAFSYNNWATLDPIPESITRIEKGTFYAFCQLKRGTSGYDKITLPKSITYIGDDAFYYSSFTNITLTSTPSHIGEDAFGYFVKTLNVPWAEGEVEGAPWGATQATINYNYVATTEV